MTLFDRNNTNITSSLANYFKNLKWDKKYNVLKSYQNYVREYINTVNSRGLLVYHHTGLGKSILAVALAIDNLFNQKRKVIILLGKSLRQNMHQSFSKYLNMRREADPEDDLPLLYLSEEDLEKWLNENISYVSANASNMITQLQKASAEPTTYELDKKVEKLLDKQLEGLTSMQTLDNTLLIVDEAHNMFRAIKNGSKNAVKMYEMIIGAKNNKVVFLSATPIATDPFELVPCFNMLDLGEERLFPEDPEEFASLYIEDGHMKNKEKFQNRIMGLVSYAEKNEEIIKEFPEELPDKVHYVKMTDAQYGAYILARQKESEESSYRPRKPKQRAPFAKAENAVSSTYRVRSRLIGNYYSKVNYKKAKDIPFDDTFSPKFKAIYDEIIKNPGKLALVYSEFVEVGGAETFARYLISQGIEEYKPRETNITVKEALEANNAGKEQKLRFALFTGKVSSEDQDAIKKAMTTQENRHGKDIAILIISATGAEGLDLKNIRHSHMLEPHWTKLREIQFKGRTARKGSHADLPPEERNVQFHLYLAVPPNFDTNTPPEKLVADQVRDITDLHIYVNGLRNYMLITEFLDSLKEVAVDCNINCFKCRECAPTGERLYTYDPFLDIRAEDPCKHQIKRTVEAQVIEYGNQDYYYIKDPEHLYGWQIYYYDELTDTHKKLPDYDQRYLEIAEILDKKK